MKKRVILASVVAFTLIAASVKAQTIAQWTFENTANTNGISLTPGAGNSSGNVAADTDLLGGSAASGKHATAATYSTPAGDVDLTLAPSISSSIHSFSANGWSVGDYWQFSTSTLGFTGVNVGWDQAGSSTGPGSFSLFYSNSLTGGAFILLSGPYTVPASTWNTTLAAPLSTTVLGGGALDNSSAVIFRLVDQSTTSVGGGTVASGGTDRVDNFTVSTIIPEPSTVALVGAGLVGLLAMRRRRS